MLPGWNQKVEYANIPTMHSQGNRKKALKIKDNVSTRFFWGGGGETRRRGGSALMQLTLRRLWPLVIIFLSFPWCQYLRRPDCNRTYYAGMGESYRLLVTWPKSNHSPFVCYLTFTSVNHDPAEILQVRFFRLACSGKKYPILVQPIPT